MKKAGHFYKSEKYSYVVHCDKDSNGICFSGFSLEELNPEYSDKWVSKIFHECPNPFLDPDTVDVASHESSFVNNNPNSGFPPEVEDFGGNHFVGYSKEHGYCVYDCDNADFDDILAWSYFTLSNPISHDDIRRVMKDRKEESIRRKIEALEIELRHLEK